MVLRFTLTDYSVNPAGVSTVIDEPINWADIKIKAVRQETHGIDFEATETNLEFFGEGFTVIKDAYDSKGIDAETILLVEIQCDDDYEELYEGNLVYPSIKFHYEDSCRVEIPVEQIGCIQTFRNRIEQQVDLDATETFDGTPLSSYAKLGDEIDLVGKPIFYTDSGSINSGYTKTLNDVGIDRLFVMELNVDKEDYDAFYAFEAVSSAFAFPGFVTFFNSEFGTLEIINVSAIDCHESTDIIIKGDIDVDVTLTVSILPGSSAPFTMYARVYHTDSAGNIKNTFTLDSHSGNVQSGSTSFNLSGSLALTTVAYAADDKFFYLIYLDTTLVMGGYLASWDFAFNSGSFTGLIASDCDATPAKVYFINEALSRTAEIISDDCLKVYSQYFGRTDSQPYAQDSDGCGGLECITNGLLIRRATLTDGTEPKMFVNFKMLFESLNSIHNIGMSLERQYAQDVLRIEHVTYYYQFEVLMTLDGVKEIHRELDRRRVYSIIKMGYEKWETEFSGGLDEFLTKREYRTESKTVTTTQREGKLEQLSKMIASGYAIEVTRRQGQTTEDYKYDNDIFIICIERGGYVGFEVEIIPDLNLIANNVLSDDNIYNIRISPVRNLLRWFKTIASSFSKEFADTIKTLIFTSGEGNYIAELGNTSPDSCWLEGVTGITENETIDKLLLQEDDELPIWEPETIKFEYPLSWQEWKTIKENPYKLLQVTQGENTFYGWVQELVYEPNSGNGDFKLLLAYDAENRI